MAHITPIPRTELPEFEAYFQQRDASIGFVPNSFLTMGRNPELLRGFIQATEAVYYQGKLDPTLKRLVAMMRSSAAGCRYCQSHTSTHALHLGMDEAKINALWEFETDERFSDAERAALRLARDAAFVPNHVTDEHFSELRRHFDDDELVELVGVVCVFAFINCWNDTVATQLEDIPFETSSQSLSSELWEAGKHTPNR